MLNQHVANPHLLTIGTLTVKGYSALDFDNGANAQTVTTGNVTIPAGTRSALMFILPISGTSPLAAVRFDSVSGLQWSQSSTYNPPGSYLDTELSVFKIENIAGYAGSSRPLYLDYAGAENLRYCRIIIVWIGRNTFTVAQTASQDVNDAIINDIDVDLDQTKAFTSVTTASSLLFAFGAAHYQQTSTSGETITSVTISTGGWTSQYNQTQFPYVVDGPRAFCIAFSHATGDGTTKSATLNVQGTPSGGGTQSGESILYLVEVTV